VKKILLTITAFIYMAVSTGIAMEVHYCMGKLAGVEYFGEEKENCGKCGMKEVGKNGCCHDEHKFVKLEDSHKQVINAIDFKYISIAIINPISSFTWKEVIAKTEPPIINYSPPILNKPDACILNCVFRI
jgi:hypothetical protein